MNGTLNSEPEGLTSGIEALNNSQKRRHDKDDYSIRQRINNVKHFTEKTRIQEINRLHSTLERVKNQISITANDSDDEDKSESDSKFEFNEDKQDRWERNDSESEGAVADNRSSSLEGMAASLDFKSNSQQSRRNSQQFITKFKNYVIGKFFKINHVLLDNHPLNSSIYQIFLLFEFIQLLFFIFHKVPVINEFMHVEASNQTDTMNNNSTITDPVLLQEMAAKASKDVITDVLSQENIYRFDLQLIFANFQLYPLQSRSFSTFQGLYGVLNALFYVTIVGMMGFADKAFKASLYTDQLKDGINLIVKSLSFLVTLFLTVLFIPLVTLNVQGFLCSEPKEDYYVLTTLKCGTSENQILTAISAITLVLFIVFCYFERILLTSPNFDSLLPWAQLQSDVGILRLIWKLYISLAFMLNKVASLKNELKLISFAIGLIICYKRLTTAKFHNRIVHFSMAVSDIVTTWLFLCIPVHDITESQLSLLSIVSLLLAGFLLACLLVYLSEMRDLKVFLDFTTMKNEGGDPLRGVKSARQAEILIYHILKYAGKTQEQLNNLSVIGGSGMSFGRDDGDDGSMRKNHGRTYALNSIIINHLDRCLQLDCTCREIYGEMFESQSFLHDTWHMIQQEETFKDKAVILENLPKFSSQLSSLSITSQPILQQKNRIQSLKQDDDNVSQNLNEINSML